MPCAARTRAANMCGGLPNGAGTPMVLPLRSSTVLMSVLTPAWMRRQPVWTPPVIFTSRSFSIPWSRYMSSVWLASNLPVLRPGCKPTQSVLTSSTSSPSSLKKPFSWADEDRRLAGQADVGDLELDRPARRGWAATGRSRARAGRRRPAASSRAAGEPGPRLQNLSHGHVRISSAGGPAQDGRASGMRHLARILFWFARISLWLARISC